MDEQLVAKDAEHRATLLPESVQYTFDVSANTAYGVVDARVTYGAPPRALPMGERKTAVGVLRFDQKTYEPAA